MSNLTEMLREVDVEDYLNFVGVDYKSGYGSSGPQLNVRECPVCGGTSWKVYLNAESGLGNCFHGSCDSRFNLWTFMKAFHGKSAAYHELERYCRDIGWRPKRKFLAVEPKSDVELPTYEEIVPESEPYEYLIRRGFDSSDIDHFRWKYCRWGSIKTPEGKDQYFSGRIIVPVFNLEGKMVTFQGRDITGKSDRKYAFPSGIRGTGMYLYNADTVKGLSEVVMGEGVFDVAAIRKVMPSEIGAIGSFGKNLSINNTTLDDQYHSLLELKKNGLRRVVYMWDSERSALLSAYKSALSVLSYGFDVAVAVLPDGCDPNEVHPNDLMKAYEEAKNLGRFDITRNIARLKMLV